MQGFKSVLPGASLRLYVDFQKCMQELLRDSAMMFFRAGKSELLTSVMCILEYIFIDINIVRV